MDQDQNHRSPQRNNTQNHRIVLNEISSDEPPNKTLPAPTMDTKDSEYSTRHSSASSPTLNKPFQSQSDMAVDSPPAEKRSNKSVLPNEIRALQNSLQDNPHHTRLKAMVYSSAQSLSEISDDEGFSLSSDLLRTAIVIKWMRFYQ
ncbi:hypothetical protein G7Y89_g8451 [Cudoniella acicularis]|uniref:Uncharacterized protein n=1 Tax=Cudoniella acicularis TaxID=354080 RepID=A0A8H4RJC6_9HELO|nr:hypothetical protein G7Y89_g8451 [Cudoniella acicularis]